MKTTVTDVRNVKKEARISMNQHIDFLKAVRSNLNSNDSGLAAGAVWTAWCLHNYINEKLFEDVKSKMSKEGNYES